jgi:hypothetical protein
VPLEDVAQVILFPLSDAARSITGASYQPALRATRQLSKLGDV